MATLTEKPAPDETLKGQYYQQQQSDLAARTQDQGGIPCVERRQESRSNAVPDPVERSLRMRREILRSRQHQIVDHLIALDALIALFTDVR